MQSKSFLCVALLSLIVSIALGSDKPNPKRDSLIRIKEIKVVVPDFSDDEIKMGFNTDSFRAQVELRLRRSGIKVNNDAISYLHIGININSPTRDKIKGLASGSIQIRFYQFAKLDANDIIMYVPTWDESVTGFFELDKVKKTKEYVDELVDEFINDYLAANQK
jgi:hypothetical protein